MSLDTARRAPVKRRQHQVTPAGASMSKGLNFEKWFDRLVRNKMDGPAVTTAGMALGLLVMSAGCLPWRSSVASILTSIGVFQIGASSLLFIAFVALHLIKAFRASSN
jgi:hypothetical protein